MHTHTYIDACDSTQKLCVGNAGIRVVGLGQMLGHFRCNLDLAMQCIKVALQFIFHLHVRSILSPGYDNMAIQINGLQDFSWLIRLLGACTCPSFQCQLALESRGHTIIHRQMLGCLANLGVAAWELRMGVQVSIQYIYIYINIVYACVYIYIHYIYIWYNIYI